MQRIARLVPGLVVALAAAFGAPGAAAQDPPAGERIAWRATVNSALTVAKDSKRPVMVCINIARVDGRTDEEPAAKGLREIVYRDPRVVAKSREFECVLLTREEGAGDYDPLRKLGIEGRIISPQHVFLASDGSRILLRKEYWQHGSGEKAVEALLALMTEAQTDPGKAGADATAGGGPPADEEGRAKWIAERLKEVAGTGLTERNRALVQLVRADREGDCTTPLIALLPQFQDNASTLRALVRALGRDGLEAAALPLTELLGHKEVTIRANAAVSLEYVGSRDKKVVAALTRAAGKDKDEGVANHAYRALGRCSAGDAKVRGLLLEGAAGGKSEFASYGPLIALAYFEGDEKAAQGVEKLLESMGVPGGRRGGGQNTVKRAVASWTLASIGGPKNGKYVREELVGGLENVKAFWVDGLRTFWTAVADVCDGKKERMADVESGVRGIAGFARNPQFGGEGADTRDLMDEARTGREPGAFKPKGDGLLGDGE